MRTKTAKRQARMAAAVAALTAAAVLAGGCVRNPGDTQGDLRKYSGPVKVQSDEQARLEERNGQLIVPIVQLQNTGYVRLDDVAAAAGFQAAWLGDGSYGVGDYDAAWVFRPGSSDATKAGEAVKLPAQAIRQNGALHVPASAIQPLFGEEAVFQIGGESIAFFPRPNAVDPATADADGLPDFADDPLAPSPDGDQPAEEAGPGGQEGLQAHGAGAMRIAATDESAGVIRLAKRYMGVKYLFGSASYAKTGRFDCSSFTQYVYGRLGEKLPRTARAQARLGKTVPRNRLQVGDLLFFYVPGRFKSNKVVGHVGIYMGGGRMIHSSPKPENGVQITPINKPYWKNTYLFAKRIL